MIEIITDLNILRAENSIVNLDEGRKIIEKLERALLSSKIKGVGLAAPQIGENKRVAIIRAENNLDLINPVIIEKRTPFVNINEGCLSVPGKIFSTNRHKEMFIKDDLHPDGFVVVGDVAVMTEHEIDHLDSILIMDRAIGKNKIGRNDPCPCGKKINGKPVKWKRCHGRNI